MTARFGTVLDCESLEARIVDTLSPLISLSREEKDSSTPKDNPAERGFVIRDKLADKCVSLPCVGALYILTDMREVDAWKIYGMEIGVPALTSTPQNERVIDEEILYTPFVRQHPMYILSSPLRLTPEQSKEIFDFLQENEQLLKELAEKDEIVTRRQVTGLFGKIAEYGRSKRLSKGDNPDLKSG